jgi:hypothetical protein
VTFQLRLAALLGDAQHPLQKRGPGGEKGMNQEQHHDQ